MGSLREHFGFWLLACVSVIAIAWVVRSGMEAATAHDALARLGDIDRLARRVGILETKVQLLSEFSVHNEDSKD